MPNPTIQTHPITITADRDGKTSHGEIRIQSWDKRERTIRALKTWALCWCGAVLSVILPLVHFILVPGLFVAGPLLAYWISGQESVILDGTASCPSCGKELRIARAKYRMPASELCTQCQSSLKISPRN